MIIELRGVGQRNGHLKNDCDCERCRHGLSSAKRVDWTYGFDLDPDGRQLVGVWANGTLDMYVELFHHRRAWVFYYSRSLVVPRDEVLGLTGICTEPFPYEWNILAEEREPPESWPSRQVVSLVKRTERKLALDKDI